MQDGMNNSFLARLTSRKGEAHMNEINKITKQMVKMFPSWMKIRKDPNSIGAQFLNVFGLEFENIEKYLQYQLDSQFIGTANLGEIDHSYRGTLRGVNKDTEIIVTKGATTLTKAKTIEEFYSADSHIYIVNYDSHFIYTRKDYGHVSVEINNDKQDVKLFYHHIWNCFDEFGLLLGISRLREESNLNFKERILDVFRRPSNATEDGLKNSIGRILGIASDHVVLNMLDDAAFIGTLLNKDGSASDTLKRFAKTIGETIPTTWGDAAWDKTYWQTVDADMLGLSYLPHIWDSKTEEFQDKDFQSGIGYGEDLQVRLPEEHKDTQVFDYYVSLQGVKEEEEEVYVPHSFAYEIHAEGTIESNVIPGEDYYYTIEAGEIIPLLFTIRAYKQYTQEFNVDYSSDYSADASLEVVSGKKITSPHSRYVKIKATLQTDNEDITPSLESLSLHWKDTSNNSQVLNIDSYEDWESPDIINIDIRQEGKIQLGQGDFSREFNTTEQWSHGQSFNIDINNGIRLKDSL